MIYLHTTKKTLIIQLRKQFYKDKRKQRNKTNKPCKYNKQSNPVPFNDVQK